MNATFYIPGLFTKGSSSLAWCSTSSSAVRNKRECTGVLAHSSSSCFWNAHVECERPTNRVFGWVVRIRQVNGLVVNAHLVHLMVHLCMSPLHVLKEPPTSWRSASTAIRSSFAAGKAVHLSFFFVFIVNSLQQS
jgi:hypothetical protein